MGKLRPEYARHAFAGYKAIERRSARQAGAVVVYKVGYFGFIRDDRAGVDNCYFAERELRLAGIESLRVGDRLEYEEGLDRFGRREARAIRRLS